MFFSQKDDSVTECVIDNPSGITAQVYHSYNAVYGNTNSRLTNGVSVIILGLLCIHISNYFKKIH